MKDRVAALCEQLGVEHSGTGLAPAVRLCAAAAGMTYETIVKTVEALESYAEYLRLKPQSPSLERGEVRRTTSPWRCSVGAPRAFSAAQP